MPTSATGASDGRVPARRGFTLIEILVVMVIIGVLGGYAVTRVNFGGNRDVQRDEARRLHVMLQLASDEAVVQTQTLGLQVTIDGYQFYRREKNSKGAWDWVKYDADGKLGGRLFADESPLFIDMELEAQLVALKTEEELNALKEPVVPQLWFLPDGEVLPQFRLTVNAKQAEREFRIEPSELQEITMNTVAR